MRASLTFRDNYDKILINVVSLIIRQQYITRLEMGVVIDSYSEKRIDLGASISDWLQRQTLILTKFE